MGSSLKIRIILDILIASSIVMFPWWTSIILVVFGIFMFNSFYEALFFGLVMDSLYGVGRNLFFNLPFIYFLLSFLLIVIISWFKRKLRI